MPGEKVNYWVHDIDPVALHLWGNFGIRYYGLSYLLAFVVAGAMFRLYQKKGKWNLSPDDQLTVLFALIFGVLLGGRIGYILLYDLPNTLRNPLSIFQVWRGGMSSHGGFIGVFIATIWICRRFKISIFRLGDLITAITPAGLLLGRLANFINGELWGKPATVPWAMIFPDSAPAGTPVELIAPRHPSQLYEAGLEGAVLLAYMQLRFWKSDVTEKHPGQLSGEFYILYGIVRILCEQFREPDAALILGMSRGIFYSFFILAAGVAVIGAARIAARKPKE